MKLNKNSIVTEFVIASIGSNNIINISTCCRNDHRLECDVVAITCYVWMLLYILFEWQMVLSMKPRCQLLS